MIPATSDTLLQAVNSWIKATDSNCRIPCGASSTFWCLVALCLNVGIDEGRNNCVLGKKIFREYVKTYGSLGKLCSQIKMS